MLAAEFEAGESSCFQDGKVLFHRSFGRDEDGAR
jgi:hypothetical protein